MEITENEGTACMRVLVTVAKADGKVTEEETAALEAAIEAYPGSDDLEGMLADTIDLDATLVEIKSPTARDCLWESAYASFMRTATRAPRRSSCSTRCAPSSTSASRRPP